MNTVGYDAVNTVGYDAVIVGAGLSGLSLAAHLATGGWQGRRVLLVDDAAAAAAACWGSWSAGPGLLDGAVSRTYDRVQVHTAGGSRVLPLGRYRYRLVRRPDLARTVSGLLTSCPGFTVHRGRVDAVRTGADHAEVLVDGRPIRASWVFDSVTVAAPAAPADAWLAFTGWEVHCTRPAFDPAVPTLFDFRARCPGRVRFGYVLPDGPHDALVELTEFVPRHAAPPSAQERRDALARYLRDSLGCPDHRIGRTESAVLPLRVGKAARRRGRILAIGAAGGLVKASTGYAFQRIQRDSQAIAASLARWGHPFDLPAPGRRYRQLDGVLLDVLDRDPAQVEQAFGRLFTANPADRVLSFLDEDTTVREELRLIATLPAAPYLRAATARTVRRLHRRQR